MAKVKSIVETVYKAKDDISKALKRMQRSSDKFGKGAEKAFDKASKKASRFKDITGGILTAGLISKGITQLTFGLTEATAQFVSFDDALVSASAKFSDLDLKTAEGQAKLKLLGKTAREVGSQTQFSATEAAAGLDFLALAGFNAEQAMSSLPGVVDLATVAQIDLARSTDIASDSLGAFGLMTKDSIQLQMNLTRVNDVMAKTMSSTNTNIEDMFEAIKKGAPDFTNAGQSMESFNALLGIMANSGVKGSEAGTKLRNVMLRLAKPTGEAQEVLDDLNVSIEDSAGNFRDVLDILADFEKGVKGMGTAQRTAALATIFGARTVGGINIILGQGINKIREFRRGLINAGGASKTMADIMRTSLGNQIKTLQSSAIELGFKFLEAFRGKGEAALKSFTEFIRGVDVMPIIESIKDIASLFGSIITVIKSITALMTPFLAAWAAYNITLAIMNGRLITSIVLSKGLAVAQFLINAAMSANPIGLSIAGVTLLIAGLVLLVANWDVVKKSFVDGATAIFNIFAKIFKLATRLTSGVFSSVSGFLGFGDQDQGGPGDDKEAGAREPLPFTPPNRTEAEAQKVGFTGLLTFKNAPENMSFESSTLGAPNISIAGLGPG